MGSKPINATKHSNAAVLHSHHCLSHFRRKLWRSKHLTVDNAQYFPFNNDASVYHSIFRVGAPNICDLVMINKNELFIKNNFNDQDLDDLYYFQLPLFDEFSVSTPSLTYNNNHLFAVGGYERNDSLFGKRGLTDIYCLDLRSNTNKWHCITANNTQLKYGKYGASLTFVSGDMLMVIGGCAKQNMETKSVELYQFECHSYIIPESDRNNGKTKNKTIALNDTQCTHFNAGIAKNISFDYNKMCIGSGQNVEIYDMCGL